jgi:hypothetical protein
VWHLPLPRCVIGARETLANQSRHRRRSMAAHACRAIFQCCVVIATIGAGSRALVNHRVGRIGSEPRVVQVEDQIVAEVLIPAVALVAANVCWAA